MGESWFDEAADTWLREVPLDGCTQRSCLLCRRCAVSPTEFLFFFVFLLKSGVCAHCSSFDGALFRFIVISRPEEKILKFAFPTEALQLYRVACWTGNVASCLLLHLRDLFNLFAFESRGLYLLTRGILGRKRSITKEIFKRAINNKVSKDPERGLVCNMAHTPRIEQNLEEKKNNCIVFRVTESFKLCNNIRTPIKKNSNRLWRFHRKHLYMTRTSIMKHRLGLSEKEKFPFHHEEKEEKTRRRRRRRRRWRRRWRRKEENKNTHHVSKNP